MSLGVQDTEAPFLITYFLCSVTSPLASWCGTQLALVQPSSFTVQPQDWDRPRLVTLTPTNVTDGNYYVSFTFM